MFLTIIKLENETCLNIAYIQLSLDFFFLHKKLSITARLEILRMLVLLFVFRNSYMLTHIITKLDLIYNIKVPFLFLTNKLTLPPLPKHNYLLSAPAGNPKATG